MFFLGLHRTFSGNCPLSLLVLGNLYGENKSWKYWRADAWQEWAGHPIFYKCSMGPICNSFMLLKRKLEAGLGFRRFQSLYVWRIISYTKSATSLVATWIKGIIMLFDLRVHYLMCFELGDFACFSIFKFVLANSVILKVLVDVYNVWTVIYKEFHSSK